MTISIIFLLGVFLGGSFFPKIDAFFAFAVRRQIKAICQKFECQKNEFTYYMEDNDGYYIVSLSDREFRVKFSISNPCQIVYCQEVECIRSNETY
ncbi:hypothetical protein Y136_03240 [Listeria monocytogenes]|nr:hypothetical protein [Listeria monocytogenes]